MKTPFAHPPLADAEHPATRWKGLIEYDGTDFEGWQSQPQGKSVQDALEARLKFILRKETRVHGSGRTDSGVHSRGQVFHIDAHWPHEHERFLKALNSGLPPTIRIVWLKPAKPTFHARYSVKRKRYVYHLYQGFAPPDEQRYRWSLGDRKLDLGAMHQAAAHLRGLHDFTSFVASNGVEGRNPVRELRRLEIKGKGRHLRIVVESDGFLYKMVRSIVGYLVAVGWGRVHPDETPALLAAKVRSERVPSAPARGLFLEKVFY